MNLLEDDVEFVARYVCGVISRNGVGHVYVRPTGTIQIYKDDKKRSRYCTPECWVGKYEKGVELAYLIDDLAYRRQEISH